MNRFEFLSKELDSRLFYEETKRVLDPDRIFVNVVIRVNDDLILDEDLKVRLQVEFDSETTHWKKVQLFLLNKQDKRHFDRKYLQENEIQESVELIFSWLRSNDYNYPISVYLYTARLLLKKNSHPWQCSVLVHKEFREYIPTQDSNQSVAFPTKLVFGVNKSKGRRNYMEDVDFIYENVKITEKEYISVFGVLDGHGGIDCAQHISDDIPMKVTSLLRQRHSSLTALYHTFKEIDVDFLRSCGGSNAGSTACILLFNHVHNLIYIANTGDTRAVLSHNNIAIDLSYDRKATDAEEIARIAYHGGFVVNGRVMGILAVARAFGDLQIKKMKPSSSSTAPGAVSSTSSVTHNTHHHLNLPSLGKNDGYSNILIVDPEISQFYPIRDDQFIIIATDGLWDVMTSQEAVDFILNELKKDEISFPICKEIH
jgi:protein phosphatase 2C family protein 2/3